MRRFTKTLGLGLALATATAACRSVTDVSSQLFITLSTDRTAIGASDSVRVTVTVANRGSHVVETWDPRSYECVSAFRVTGPAGAFVPLPGRFCLAVAYAARHLAPGQSVTIQDSWRGDVEGTDGKVKLAPPGQYRIAARVFAEGNELGSAPVDIQLTR